ncbi:hypothetical protein Clacol_005035 [Clathrus columnatus]|uniref:Uncharacterized protein n=1 Tax=Clathrus columnatus TaxID=1419009 RepID=A0AAV5AAU0_9AGAM|nr:hypothetical protein Clacol_005035 [Clathrus columnatus]
MPQAHAIFGILELVEAILSWMSPRQTFRTALVNRLWFDASIRYLWHTMFLEQALLQLGEAETHHHGFSSMKPLTKKQWERFLTYSKHLRVLRASALHKDILRAATKIRLDGLPYLFPNLRALTWKTTGEVPDLSSLISPSLESFTLTMGDLKVPSFQHISHLLINRLRVL